MAFGGLMLVAGMGVGLLSGALGLGGGILMLPAFLAFVPGIDAHTAKGTSLSIVVLVAFCNAWRLERNQPNVPWRLAAVLSAASIAGSFFGAWATTKTPEKLVLLIFMSVLFYLGIQTFMLKPVRVHEADVRRNSGWSILIGLIAGVVGGATGTGGGIVMVPLALKAGIASNHRVVGLSNMMMVPTAAAGAAAHLQANQSYAQAWTAGQIYLPLIPLVFLGAQLASPLGARINAKLSLHRRRMLLGSLLVLISIQILLRLVYSTAK